MYVRGWLSLCVVNLLGVEGTFILALPAFNGAPPKKDINSGNNKRKRSKNVVRIMDADRARQIVIIIRTRIRIRMMMMKVACRVFDDPAVS